MANTKRPYNSEKRKKYYNTYYKPTSGIYDRRTWEPYEESVIMTDSRPDAELSKVLCRSIKSIQNRRMRLRKIST